MVVLNVPKTNLTEKRENANILKSDNSTKKKNNNFCIYFRKLNKKNHKKEETKKIDVEILQVNECNKVPTYLENNCYTYILFFSVFIFSSNMCAYFLNFFH